MRVREQWHMEFAGEAAARGIESRRHAAGCYESLCCAEMIFFRPLTRAGNALTFPQSQSRDLSITHKLCSQHDAELYVDQAC
jgi:hypothetical protein